MPCKTCEEASTGDNTHAHSGERKHKENRESAKKTKEDTQHYAAF